MNPALRSVAVHMRELGLGALAHAMQHSLFSNIFNQYWAELAVLQAAHASEILIKARIAEEHPLLLFDGLPKASQAKGELLDLEDLFEKGKTIQFSQLPDRLWGATGIRLSDEEHFTRFGKLRNNIQHFAAPPKEDLRRATMSFVFSVLDPFINGCWSLFAFDIGEDPDHQSYLWEYLEEAEITFLVPPTAVGWINDKVDALPNGEYQRRMKTQLAISGSQQRRET